MSVKTQIIVLRSFLGLSSWDTHRTVHPLLSITSPFEWAEIVNAYIDGWRNTGTLFPLHYIERYSIFSYGRIYT